MKKKVSVKTAVFQAMQNIDTKQLEELEPSALRPVLPCLVRTALCGPVDKSAGWTKARKVVLKILAGIEDVNSIVALLSIDFHALEQDVKKEQQLRYFIAFILLLMQRKHFVPKLLRTNFTSLFSLQNT